MIAFQKKVLKKILLPIYLGQEKLINLLIKHGAKINAVDNEGRTPLNLVIKDGNSPKLVLSIDVLKNVFLGLEKAADVLIKNGAIVNINTD